MNKQLAAVWSYVSLRGSFDALSILCLVYLAERSERNPHHTTIKQLSRATGLSTSTIGGRLSRLRDAGLLVRTWSGNVAYYRLNDNFAQGVTS